MVVVGRVVVGAVVLGADLACAAVVATGPVVPTEPVVVASAAEVSTPGTWLRPFGRPPLTGAVAE